MADGFHDLLGLVMGWRSILLTYPDGKTVTATGPAAASMTEAVGEPSTKVMTKAV